MATPLGPSGPDLRGLPLYRVRMVDSGEQFLKVNSNAARSAWVDSGVACSQFLMTPTGRQNIERAFGCYTGGIDVHSGRGWRRIHPAPGAVCRAGSGYDRGACAECAAATSRAAVTTSEWSARSSPS